jgi:hypothetical protein
MSAESCVYRAISAKWCAKQSYFCSKTYPSFAFILALIHVLCFPYNVFVYQTKHCVISCTHWHASDLMQVQLSVVVVVVIVVVDISVKQQNIVYLDVCLDNSHTHIHRMYTHYSSSYSCSAL